jgi:hypothetical protein
MNQPLLQNDASVFFTVPKTSDIDRVACKEPEVNMLLQRSVGNHIRHRLRTFGVDLNDQTKNNKLAQVAVQKGLATIDLSSASDSITRQLVINLLPFEWWSLLDDLRVKHTLIDGTLHELEMFSSMGNGFTFELESLLFYAITRTVCRFSGIKGTISVFGDDIIAPSAIVRRLRRVFFYFGFKMNPKKTHYASRDLFRESCGEHYYNGVSVTPFYIRREVDNLPDLINHLNHLLEWDGRGWGFFINEESYQFWARWIKYVPRSLWGGIDPFDPSALVTGHPPRKRLVPRVRDMRVHPIAGYVHWHMVRLQFGMPSWRKPENHVELDPHIEIGFKAEPVISCGARTTWNPGLITRHVGGECG